MISFLYIILIFFLIKNLRFFKLKGISKAEIIFGVCIQFFASYLLYIVYTQYYIERYTADIFKFYDDSLVLHQLFFDKPLDFIKILIGFDISNNQLLINPLIEMNHWDSSYKSSVMNESRLIIKINALLNIIGFKSYVFNMLSFVLIGYLGKILIVKSLLKKFKLKYPKILFWSFVLMPSLLIWTSGILKEPLLIFSFGLVIHFLVSDRKKKWFNFSSLLLGLYIIFKIKFYVFICFFPALASYIISHKYKLKPFLTIASASLILAILMVVFTQFNSTLNPIKILASKQNDFIRLAKIFDAGSSINMTPLEPNLRSLLSAIPAGIINSFFRPLPNDIHETIHLLPLIENIFIFLGLFLTLLKISQNKIQLKKNYKNLIWHCSFFILLMYTLIGIGTPVIGALVRYKIPGLIFILISLNLLYDSFKKNIAE